MVEELVPDKISMLKTFKTDAVISGFYVCLATLCQCNRPAHVLLCYLFIKKYTNLTLSTICSLVNCPSVACGDVEDLEDCWRRMLRAGFFVICLTIDDSPTFIQLMFNFGGEESGDLSCFLNMLVCYD